MKAHHSDGDDGEILSSSLNNNSEDNIFLSLCLKGGLTSEQIYSLLLQREETKRKELDLEILKLEQQQNNKRKFNHDDDEFKKNKKIKNSTINLCDEMILQILEFLNEDFHGMT